MKKRVKTGRFSVTKRLFLKRHSLAMAFLPTLSTAMLLGKPGHGYGANVNDALSSKDAVLMRLFQTSEAAEDASIVIDAPIEAEHIAYVPFRITAVGAEKLAIFVEPSDEPLAACFTLSPLSGSTVMGTLDLREGSTISCYALKNEQLYQSSRYVRPSISGYEN